MSKFFLMAFLAALSSSAMADWVKVFTDKTDTHFVEPTTMSSVEGRILMFDVTEMITKGHPFSVKMQREYDCQGKRVRIMNMTAYRGTFGEGEELMNNPAHEDWQTLQKKSALESLFRFACGKQ